MIFNFGENPTMDVIRMLMHYVSIKSSHYGNTITTAITHFLLESQKFSKGLSQNKDKNRKVQNIRGFI